MADKKITDLNSATSANDTDILLLVQGLETKQITFLAFMNGIMRGANNLGEITDQAQARNNIGVNSPTQITNEINTAIATHYTNTVVPAISAAETNAINTANAATDTKLNAYVRQDILFDILSGVAIFRDFSAGGGTIFNVEKHQNVIIVLDDEGVNDTITNQKTYQIRLPDAINSEGRWIAVMVPQMDNANFIVYIRETSDGQTNFTNSVTNNDWPGLRSDGSELAWSDPASAPNAGSVQTNNMAFTNAVLFYSDGSKWDCKRYDSSISPIDIPRV
jgi:hypothetical protein